MVTDVNNFNKFCKLRHILGTGFSKKGVIGSVPDGSIGIGAKQKRGSLGIWSDQKRAIDRHMTGTHILECPPPPGIIPSPCVLRPRFYLGHRAYTLCSLYNVYHWHFDENLKTMLSVLAMVKIKLTKKVNQV